MNPIFKFAFIFIVNIIFLINASATTMDKDKFVEANGIKIHYLEGGRGTAAVIDSWWRTDGEKLAGIS